MASFGMISLSQNALNIQPNTASPNPAATVISSKPLGSNIAGGKIVGLGLLSKYGLATLNNNYFDNSGNPEASPRLPSGIESPAVASAVAMMVAAGT